MTLNKNYLRQAVLSIFTLFGSFVYGFELDGLSYEVISMNPNRVSVSCIKGAEGSYSGNLYIPQWITYYDNLYTVYDIRDYAFDGCSGFNGSLSIPNSVIYIGNSAFRSCSGFTGSLKIPDSVISIEAFAFKDCKGFTGSLTIPYSVKSLGREVFKGCTGFTGALIIPESIKAIGDETFSGCTGLTSLTIPNSVSYIGESAFAGCSGFTGSLIIPNSVTFIWNTAFSGCTGFTGPLVIPNSVTEIYGGCFSGCTGFTSLTIPNSVESIESAAFYGCSGLENVYSDIVTPFSIDIGTFWGISSSAILHIPKGTKSLYQQFSGWTKHFKYILEEGESIPSDTYSLSITSIGNGSASYGGESVRGKTKTYTINEGTSVTVKFNPDNGYRISSLKVNGSSVTASASYTTTINTDTSIEVEFEAIPPTTYTLSIKAAGNGSASYGGESIRGTTRSYTVNEGTNISVSFTADSGYRIKSLKVNGTSITASTSYTTTVNADTSIEVEFEAIPITTYTLSIKAIGNGFASYSGENIRETTKSYTVNDGTSVTIKFSPDPGYRVKSLKVNGSSVTASTSYTTTINADTSIEVEFEAIPSTTYTLTIKAIGNGSASYSGESIRGKTKTFTVNEGTKVTISFSPDDGYQIKSLKVNNAAVTVNSSYSATINSDTSVEVEYEAKPDVPKTYTLSIRAKGNGIATYNGETIRATTKTYTLEEGTKIALTFTPDEGNQIKSLRVKDEYITITDSYETTINADISIKIDFEEIPLATYTLSIKAKGNGIASYGDETIRDNTSTFTLNEGTTGTITFTPDEGYHIKSLMVNSSAIGIDSSYDFTMNSDTSVEVEFEVTIVEREFTIDGTNYEITSFEDHTVIMEAGDYGLILVVPEKINYQDEEWTVTGIAEGALDQCEDLAAIIWNIEKPFNARIANPNLLLYVKNEAYAPATIKNVVVNGFAKAITLTDAQSGNNFYCPEAFIAQSVVYTHNYSMKTGLNESKGWETIALPFDVQIISHSSKGEIEPFGNWTSGSSTKPFWLYELTGSGFVETESIKANTPYIISMPNNGVYPNDYMLAGRVSYSAINAEVKKSDEVQTATFSNHTFIPSFINHNAEATFYALNVNNDYENYEGSDNEGSKFILGLRKIHPFEAYMTSTSGTRSIDISEGMTTGIRGIEEIVSSPGVIKVYDLSGRLIKTGATMDTIRQELPSGVYIINNKKMIIK